MFEKHSGVEAPSCPTISNLESQRWKERSNWWATIMPLGGLHIFRIATNCHMSKKGEVLQVPLQETTQLLNK
jgi:hypothetical protein